MAILPQHNNKLKGTHPRKGVGQALLPAQLLRLVHCDYQVATQQQR